MRFMYANCHDMCCFLHCLSNGPHVNHRLTCFLAELGLAPSSSGRPMVGNAASKIALHASKHSFQCRSASAMHIIRAQSVQHHLHRSMCDSQCAMQLLEEQAASGNAEALDEFLQKYAGSRAQLDRSSNGNIPAQYSQQDLDLTAGERSITSSVRWMNAF